MNPDKSNNMRKGPLAEVRVVEFAGIGPAPFACMLLSDMGADVVRIERPDAKLGNPNDIVGRGRRTVLLDLKDPNDFKQATSLIEAADVLIEGFRPGVMERLGFGPDSVLKRNAALVYGRMTGWGQEGPLAQSAGHDINYISITGALAAIGPNAGPPVPPLNLVGDYGGGSLYLVAGVLAALFDSRRTGKGQVVDAAICDGVFSMMSTYLSQTLQGNNLERRGSNMLDGGAPYYSVYKTKDDGFISVGPIEPKFFGLFCEILGVNIDLRDAQNDKSKWGQLRQEFSRIICTRTRTEWEKVFEGSDACVAPILTLSEAQNYPHNKSRNSFQDISGIPHPSPAPRFSHTASAIQGAAPTLPTHILEIQEQWKLPKVTSVRKSPL